MGRGSDCLWQDVGFMFYYLFYLLLSLHQEPTFSSSTFPLRPTTISSRFAMGPLTRVQWSGGSAVSTFPPLSSRPPTRPPCISTVTTHRTNLVLGLSTTVRSQTLYLIKTSFTKTKAGCIKLVARGPLPVWTTSGPWIHIIVVKLYPWGHLFYFILIAFFVNY